MALIMVPWRDLWVIMAAVTFGGGYPRLHTKEVIREST